VGGLLALRKSLDLFANIRPVVLLEKLQKISPLSPRVTSKGVDMMTVRELSSGIYFGQPKELKSDQALDTMLYRRDEVERIARVAFKAAQARKGRVTSVDKANVLNTSVLWRETVKKIAEDYKTVQLNHMYVDNAAMQMIINPSQFDVILTSNLFGDIISDESAAITNSLGLLPSASLGKNINLFEPAGGSAPDIAGKNLANPIAQILSLAMMFDYSFSRKDISKEIYVAVKRVIDKDKKTADISLEGEESVTTSEFGDLVCNELS
jgi:3-isopropylmalate dehydrogenase